MRRIAFRKQRLLSYQEYKKRAPSCRNNYNLRINLRITSWRGNTRETRPEKPHRNSISISYIFRFAAGNWGILESVAHPAGRVVKREV